MTTFMPTPPHEELTKFLDGNKIFDLVVSPHWTEVYKITKYVNLPWYKRFKFCREWLRTGVKINKRSAEQLCDVAKCLAILAPYALKDMNPMQIHGLKSLAKSYGDARKMDMQCKTVVGWIRLFEIGPFNKATSYYLEPALWERSFRDFLK